jgi:hypothetical protein
MLFALTNQILRSATDSAVSHAYLMLRLSRCGRLEPANLSFLHLLGLSMGLITSDPRDSIFALLGLQTKDHDPAERPLLQAEYKLSLSELNLLVAERLMEAEKGPNFLISARCLRQPFE